MKNIMINVLIISILTISCGVEDSDPSSELLPATNLAVKDVSNFSDVRDFRVSFNKPRDISLISGFRVFIVPEAVSSNFTVSTALGVMNYLTVDAESPSSNIQFPTTQKDSQGDTIVEGKQYVIYVLTLGDSSEGVLSLPSKSIVLEQRNVVRTLTTSLSEGTGGMDVDAEGNIYVANFGLATNQANGNNVLKITPEGEVSNFAAGFSGASGNDFDGEGNLYQSNIGGNTVSKVTPEGEVSTFAVGLSNPVGIAFNGDSLFYVCNCGNDTISKVNMDGMVTEFASSSLFNCPNGIDIDDQGNLYIASFGSPVIVKITSNGSISSFATMPGSNNGHLLIRDDFIYVVSRGLHQIHKVSFNGEVSLLAGSGSRGIIDGSLTEANFSLPNDIAFSPDGRFLYVNDVNGNNPDLAIISPSIIRVIELVE